MTEVRTITLYNAVTGELGPIISGAVEDIKASLAFTHVIGAFDNTRFRFNVETQSIEEITTPRKPLIHELRNTRDELLNNYRWTIMPDSPLTEESKAEWLLYLKELHSLLININPENTDEVVWPTKPTYQYL